jgi:hypothetical protein
MLYRNNSKCAKCSLASFMEYALSSRSHISNLYKLPLDAAGNSKTIYSSYALQEIKHKYGPDAIMLTGSARGPGNEANYVMQKFARAVIGTNNIKLPPSFPSRQPKNRPFVCLPHDGR